MPRYQWARVGVKGVLFRRHRLLLLRRRDDLPLLPSLWDLPGGGVEVGDSLEATLVREVREETGFTVRVGRPIHAWMVRLRFVSGRSLPGIIVCYECSTRNQGRPRLDPREHTDFAWIANEELAGHRVPPNQLIAIQKAFAEDGCGPMRRRSSKLAGPTRGTLADGVGR